LRSSTRGLSGAESYRGTTTVAVKRKVRRRPAPNRTVFATSVAGGALEKPCPVAPPPGSRWARGIPAFAKMLELSIGIFLPRQVIEVAFKRMYAGARRLAERFKAITIPETVVPAEKIGFPCTTIGSSSTASKESPTFALALEIEDLSRTVKGVPAGTSAGDGISEEVGDIPSSCLG
jgi:hypothetical protein